MARGVGELNTLSVRAIARGISAGNFTAEAVVRDCLSRIDAREQEVKAWAFIDAEMAIAQARAVDKGAGGGVLHGVPIGIKDVIDVFDMPTQMGSPIYKGYRPGTDASSTALLRAAGAIIMGKTITCEFAGLTPNITTNPHDATRTPGGSSSGSAAAVSDFMIPAATGTQTGGSVLRPASYCGVVGYKPSYNLIPRGGMKFAAESRDTIGVFARDVDDADLLASALTGRPAIQEWSSAAPRIGLCRTHHWDAVHQETIHAIEDAAQRLWAAGAVIREVSLPTNFADLSEARTVVNPFERARALAHEWNMHPELLSDKLRAMVEAGQKIPYESYIATLQMMKERRDQLAGVFDGIDVLLTPCVQGEAPVGLGFTGETRFQEFWTALHVPTLSLPTHKGPNGMPVGIQLVGAAYQDKRLLGAAHWAFARLVQG